MARLSPRPLAVAGLGHNLWRRLTRETRRSPEPAVSVSSRPAFVKARNSSLHGDESVLAGAEKVRSQVGAIT